MATQDAVVEESVTLVGDKMVQTAEAEVREGVMAITPTPPPPPGRTEDAGRRSEMLVRR